MARIIGDNATNKIKLPCTPPAQDDVLKVHPSTPGTGVWGKLQDGNVDSTRSLVTSNIVDGSKNIDFNASSGWVNKTLDALADGATFGKVSVNALASGNIDFSKSGFANKDLDHLSDGTTYKRVTGVTSGQVTSSSISSSAVGSGQLASGAVIAGKISAGTIVDADISSSAALSGSKLASGSVTGTQIGTGAVGSGQLASGAVVAGKITAGTIVDADINASAALSGSKLAAGTITGTQIGTGAVGSGQLASAAVIAGKISAGTIVDADISVSAALSGSKLASGSVTGTQIGTGAVGSAQLASGAVVAGKITAGTIVDADISSSAALSGSKLASGSVTGTQLATSAVGSGQLASGAVVAGKIGSGAIVDADISSGANLSGSKLATNSLTGDKFTTGALVIPSSSLQVAGPVSFTPPSSDGIPLAWVFDRATTNEIANPSFEVNATDGWTAHGTGTTLVRDTTIFNWGVASGKVTAGSSSGNWGITSGFATAAAGEQWSASVDVAFTASGKALVLRLQFYDALGTSLQSEAVKTYAAGNISFGNSRRAFIIGTATNGSGTVAKVRLKIETSSASAVFYSDGVQLEKKNWPTTYCDGSLGPGYSWSGTSNNSSSSRTNGWQHLGGLDGTSARPTYLDDQGNFVNEFTIQCGTPDVNVQLVGDGGATTGTGSDAGVQIDARQSRKPNVDVRIIPGGTGKVLVGYNGAIFRFSKGGTSQSVGTGETQVTFNTDVFNIGNVRSGSNFVAPENGIYLIGACIQFTGMADATYCFSYLKGSVSGVHELLHMYASGASQIIEAATSVLVQLVATETVGVYAQTSGAARTVSGQADRTYFWGTRIA